MQSGLLFMLGEYGCQEIPKPATLKHTIRQASLYTFIVKPTAALVAMRSGIPEQHQPFWSTLGLSGLQKIYEALSVSPSKVLCMFEDVSVDNARQEQILRYLRQIIGSMGTDELRHFPRYVTGSSVCLPGQTDLSFSSLEGIARRPIAHTCAPSLELSLSYETYPEFATEFRSLVSDQYAWIMDAI